MEDREIRKVLDVLDNAGIRYRMVSHDPVYTIEEMERLHLDADAEIANKTDVVLTSVAGNEKAIGYISLGALNDTVKAVKVDGAEATVDNVKAGTYKLSRPFNIATKGEPTGVAKDFINFILSKEGQAVVTDNKYIAVDDNAAAFTSDGSSGQIAVGGSSSVSPVMEKLKERQKDIKL